MRVVKHSFTHFDLKANVIVILFDKNKNFNVDLKYNFFNIKKIKLKEIPTLYNKIIKNALEKLNV